MALYKAKIAVTFKEILRAIGDTFEVSVEEAASFGWDKENGTVELVEATAPAAPVEPEAVTPETPSPEVTPEAPAAPVDEVTPETTPAA